MAKMYCYLVVSKKRVLRVNTKDMPQVNPGEYAFKINLDIPDVYFDQAIPQVNIKVSPDHLVTAPIEATTQPFDNTDHYQVGTGG